MTRKVSVLKEILSVHNPDPNPNPNPPNPNPNPNPNQVRGTAAPPGSTFEFDPAA